MSRNALLFSLMLVACFNLLHGQQLNHKQGDVILCLHPGKTPLDMISRHAVFENRATDFKLNRCLSKHMNIWKASFEHSRIHELRFIQRLVEDAAVLIAQQNHFLSKRNTRPDDPLFSRQWQWINLGPNGMIDADIDADEAWDLVTGGISALGDTIVVASIDVGVDYDHPDLFDNIWMNTREIPNNRLDDDGNGYVDDVRGWNVLLENDNIEPELFGGGVEETHGTEILGVIGAIGNNGVGIAGLNWDIKMMNVFFNSDLNEADMIAAYGYILEQRKLYNKSGGEQGAYVVATNLSYGDEEITPDDAPIWCAVYDSLGAQGILNCIATSNNALDLDSVQDVPSSCTSDYMLAVTATDESDVRSFAAFGKQDIDLAAPGDNLYTTSIPGYDFVTGTSYAAPMVAAAIGLLYASPCSDLASLAVQDPGAAAIMARENILSSVDQITQLQNEIASGGRLNMFSSLQNSISSCSSCVAPFGIAVTPLRDSLTIAWSVTDSVNQVDLAFKRLGDTMWQTFEDIQSPFSIGGLSTCTEYEYEFSATCADGSSAAGVRTIASTLCCDAPTQIIANILSSSSAAIEWDTVEAASQYLVRWSPGTTSDWDTILSNTPTLQLDNLRACTEYIVQVQSLCFGTEVTPSDTSSFTTLGCGACLDSSYCVPEIDVAGEEWIAKVTLGTLANESGYERYGDFTGGDPPILFLGQSYKLAVTPGFENDSLMDEHIFAWIDYDHSGAFDNGEELIYASEQADTGTQSAIIVIPMKATEGLTRLRIALIYEPEDSVNACDDIDFGEMEDYCVLLRFDSLLCPLPTNIDTVNFAGTSTDVTWDRVDSAIAYTIRYRKVDEEDWEEAADTSNSYTLEGLEDCAEYEVQVQAVCAFDTSGYTESFVFSTFCSTNADELYADVHIVAFPNPFTERIAVDIQSAFHGPASLNLYDLNGKLVEFHAVNLSQGRQLYSLDDLSYLSSGIYVLKVKSNHGSVFKRIIKQ
ncbi:MAG: S8 family serine peptidase [Saprospiraceae bacterium]|nr:S8 family serine peptidase [Saprospiraceae bacterium]